LAIKKTKSRLIIFKFNLLKPALVYKAGFLLSNCLMKKAAIITGASSGIGAATAIEFSKQGYFVFLAGRNEERLTAVAEKCSAGASLLKIDFKSPASIEKYAKHLFERPDVDIQVLINNAGIFTRQDFINTDLKTWREQFEVNFFGSVDWTQKVLPLFLKKNSGSIVNVSSTLGLKPTAGTSAYSASKAALINWTQTLALELGPKGIRVNCVCPGIVDTPIHPFHKQTAITDTLKNLQPLGRIGQPEEIAKAIYFLAGPDSAWTTGAVLNVDGGIHLA
jgi:NAD(P)-dependent dehydrogenase (short-subunit alcohol dehydrogenase family)